MTYTFNDIARSHLQTQHQISISVQASNHPVPPLRIFNSATSNTANDSEIILHGGTYIIMSLKVPSDDDDPPNLPGHINKVGDIHTIDHDGKMTLTVGSPVLSSSRSSSREVANFWNSKIQACQTTHYQHAENLDFAFIGTLILDVTNSKLGRMKVTFPNVGFARGFDGSNKRDDSVWWFGGQTFERIKDKDCQDSASTCRVRALGSDREGRARFFYFSSTADGVALTRIFGY